MSCFIIFQRKTFGNGNEKRKIHLEGHVGFEKKNINGITFHYYFYVKNANSKTRDFIHDIQRYMYAIVGVSEL